MAEPIRIEVLPSWSSGSLLPTRLRESMRAGRLSCSEFGSHFAAIEWMSWASQRLTNTDADPLDTIQRMKTALEAAASTEGDEAMEASIAELQILLWELNRRTGKGPMELLIAIYDKVSKTLKGIQG
ncbi:hypothetical protein [Tuwongella immobilis]|uniref:Uncharacterized protein n=1 Tax=Tuwongella immobilis TaxID=692036 RepID=A0A6C2YQ20_9BACT|nr:hypothetical protein [Tuwongella immobilis]VIP02982.1 unnamed protein product [Tuwongella immobilis]VTS03034.1 unnamed protein product [Tuwongella immobilis]